MQQAEQERAAQEEKSRKAAHEEEERKRKAARQQVWTPGLSAVSLHYIYWASLPDCCTSALAWLTGLLWLQEVEAKRPRLQGPSVQPKPAAAGSGSAISQTAAPSAKRPEALGQPGPPQQSASAREPLFLFLPLQDLTHDRTCWPPARPARPSHHRPSAISFVSPVSKQRNLHAAQSTISLQACEGARVTKVSPCRAARC